MIYNEIVEIVKDALIDSIPHLNKNQINPKSHLKNDLGIDSLSSIFLLTYLEENIKGFSVNENTIEAKHFNTLETISQYVKNELK